MKRATVARRHRCGIDQGYAMIYSLEALYTAVGSLPGKETPSTLRHIPGTTLCEYVSQLVKNNRFWKKKTATSASALRDYLKLCVKNCN